MFMLGSNGAYNQSTTPFTGWPNGDVRDPALMRLASLHANEASSAEKADSPASSFARERLDKASGPDGPHRMHPDCPVWAFSLTFGYCVELHEETSAAFERDDHNAHASESISFMCADQGCTTHFYVAGTLLRLPKDPWQVVRVYIPYPRWVFHGTLPRTDGAGRVEAHGNVGSAIVTRCHHLPLSHPARTRPHSPGSTRPVAAKQP